MSQTKVIAAVAAIALLLCAAPAGASSVQHCVVRVVGQRPSGELITTAAECFDRFDQAMAATGIAGATSLKPGASSSEIQAVNSTTTTASIIGIHYDGLNWSGSSMTVSGSDCAGGWINADLAWSNRIRSTSNGCYRIRHWDLANKAGDWEETYGLGGNLSSLDRRTNSIQYLS